MDNNQISELVKASIQTQIIQAFKDAPEAIEALVSACLNQEVNEHGGKPDYYAKEKMPYLTFLARSTIQGVAMKIVKDYISEIEPQIREQIKNSLSKAEVTDAFTRSILQAVSEDWRINIDFKTVNKNE